MFAYARHWTLFLALVELLSDKLRSAYPDPGAWDEVDPSAGNQTFLGRLF